MRLPKPPLPEPCHYGYFAFLFFTLICSLCGCGAVLLPGAQVPGRLGGRHPPCQCVDPADAEHPSLNPLCKWDPPQIFSVAQGHPCPAPCASRGNLAAGAGSSPTNPAPCHRPRVDGNKHVHEPAHGMPFHKGSGPAGTARCWRRCRSIPACFQASGSPGARRGRGSGCFCRARSLVSAGHPLAGCWG